MILAAGRGERLRPLTDSTPKALVEVGGRTLLERHLDRVAEAGIRGVVINLGWLGERIVSRIGDGSAFGLKVSYSDERDEVLETGGGVHKALPLLGEQPFVVINADILTDMPVPDVSLDAQADAHLVLVRTPDYREQGDFDIEDGWASNTRTHTFSGVSVFRPRFFAGCEAGRFSVVPLLREAADERRLQASFYDGHWADVGTPARLAAANEQQYENKNDD